MKPFGTLVVVTILLLPDVSQLSAGQERFVLKKVEGGYLRLDRHIGTVAFCSLQDITWRCSDILKDDPVVDEQLAPVVKGTSGKWVLAQQSFRRMRDRFLHFVRRF